MKKVKSIGAIVLAGVMLVSSVLYSPAKVASAAGSWEEVVVDDIEYWCVTDSESPDLGKAYAAKLADEDKQKTITSLNIKSSVTYDGKEYPVVAIGSSITSGFDGCTELKTVNIPDSITTIYDRAFAECYSLEELVVPRTVTTIGEQAFAEDYIEVYGYSGSAIETYANTNPYGSLIFIPYDADKTWNSNYFSVTTSDSIAGKYKCLPSDMGIVFYSKKCYEESNKQQGWLFTFATYTDDYYKELPNYDIVKKSGGQVYVVEDPTDVQTEGLSDEAKAEYAELLQERDKIAASLIETVTVPKKPTIKSVKNVKGKKAKITLKSKVAGVTGYEYSYSTSKKFTSAKTKRTSKKTLTLTKLKKGKTYYVRVRAYSDPDHYLPVYGSWSAVKTVKIKK